MNTLESLEAIEKSLEETLGRKERHDIDSFYKDHLTGLLNGLGLEAGTPILALLMIRGKILEREKIRREIIEFDEKDKRNSATNIWSLMYCDINGLKAVNDKHGHHIGDEGIKQIVPIINDILKDCIRSNTSDVLFHGVDLNNAFAIRKHGDEFIIILPNCAKEDAEKIKDKINAEIRKKIKETRGLTLAIGIVDTTEVDIPPQINNGILDEQALHGFLENMIIKSDQDMGLDKVRNMSPEDRKRSMWASLERMAGIWRLDLKNPSHRRQLVEYIEQFIEEPFVDLNENFKK